MSLIMALKTYSGIVMTADRLSTLYVKNESIDTIDCFPKSFNTHKLFVMKNGYGISYCGDGIVDNKYLMEQFVQEVICSKNYDNYKPKKIAKDIMQLLQDHNLSSILLFCGYYNNIPFIFSISFKKIEEYLPKDQTAAFRFGDTSIADKLLSSDFYYGYSTYRMQDAINLLTCVNLTTAKFQQFQEVLQTVSEECDVLVLFKNGEYKWLKYNELHI